jgi:hypothetical protein
LRTEYPRDLSRLSVAARMDASSSTTAITPARDLGTLLTRIILVPTGVSARSLGVSDM